MSLRIQHNVAALGAYNTLSSNTAAVERSMHRLSTGFRINSAADDAAGLAISEKMRGQIGGLRVAQDNISDAINLIQTSEGALSEVSAMLQRVRDLSVQYKNGTMSTAERSAIQTEVNNLASEIERVGSSTKFNGVSLLNVAAGITFQIGADDGQAVTFSSISLGASIGATYFSLTATGTTDISEIDAAISAVTTQRSSMGAAQNRMEYTFNSQATYMENLVASESRIRDADMAQEIVDLTKNQILAQSSQAMLGQAVQSPSSILQLLGG